MKLVQIWLKMPIPAQFPQIYFFGVLSHKHYFSPLRPQKALPWLKPRNDFKPLTVAIGTEGKEYKRGGR